MVIFVLHAVAHRVVDAAGRAATAHASALFAILAAFLALMASLWWLAVPAGASAADLVCLVAYASVVYVGLGSHANYFGPGEMALEKRCWGQIVVDIVAANKVKLVDHAGKGRVVRLRLVRVTATAPQWMGFAGTWGEDGYVHFPNVEPPFHNEAGPPGPAFHAQWRKPLSTVLGWPAG